MARLLPGEDPEEHESMRTGWLKEWEPEGYMEERLVENLFICDWLLLRAQHNRFKAETRAAGDKGLEPADWSEEDAHQVELAQRYLTTAERSFYRALNALLQLRKDIMRRDTGIFKVQQENEKLRAQVQQFENNQPKAQGRIEKPAATAQRDGKRQAKPEGKPQIMDQWIEIEMVDGQAVVSYHPSNEELWEEGKKMVPPPTMVYRRFHFVDAVPSEYAWTTSDPQTMEFGGLGIQRMSVDTWLRIIEEEKATGKPGKCGGNLPKPEAWGHCECKSCTANRERLKSMAQ
ncbi:MAG: hypothetical protein JO138_13800 [Acidobacteriaceae bacterium]|nr:hypothetical protein [Acidobacteriaceae bacterium]